MRGTRQARDLDGPQETHAGQINGFHVFCRVIVLDLAASPVDALDPEQLVRGHLGNLLVSKLVSIEIGRQSDHHP